MKLTGGWVLRPAGDRQTSVTLRLETDPAVLDVASSADPLVVPLTPRRAGGAEDGVGDRGGAGKPVGNAGGIHSL